MPDDFYEKPALQDPPVAVSHIVRTLRAYLPVIALSLAAVMVGYAILAVAIYVLSPSQSVTSLRFRVEFKGADQGEYPNGTKFSSAEIITTPVLLKAYQANDLDRFTTFADFTKSIFVLESNIVQETLNLEYQSRLSDPKLTPVERDRLQREYESKLASLSKDEFSLNYLRPSRVRSIPEVVVRKTLHDILTEWADFVSKEQNVLEYRVALLSPTAVSQQSKSEGLDPIVATQMMRAVMDRVQGNIENLRRVPAADLIHTKGETELSLIDLATRVEDIVRFKLDPLVQDIAASNLLTDRPSTIRFLEAQLAYDQRTLDIFRERTEAARNALALYMGTQPEVGDITPVPTNSSQQQNGSVMPLLQDSFVDRMMQLASNSADLGYRKTLTEEYRESAIRVAPLEQYVAYDQTILDTVRRNAGGGAPMTRQAVDQQLAVMRTDLLGIVHNIHEIHGAVSRNMNPSTQLLTLIGVPATRFERSIGVKKLVLYGILTCFIALPIIVVLCLLHNRIREEEEAERSVSGVPGAVQSTV
jgi:hypothetical protein